MADIYHKPLAYLKVIQFTFLTLFTVLVAITSSFAQNNLLIKGKVIDASNNETFL